MAPSKTEQIARAYASGKINYYEALEQFKQHLSGLHGDAITHILQTAKTTVAEIDKEKEGNKC
jgi:hypothetical protein